MTYKISDIATEIREPYVSDKVDSLPYIGLEHVEQGSLHLSSIGSSQEVGSNKIYFKSDDILFGTLRPYFRKIITAPCDGICSTEFCVIRTNNPEDQKFVFYALALPQFIKYATTNSNGARPRTKWKLFSDFKLPKFNSLQRQDIGNILSAYDDLIENNRRRIQLLEQAARLLYKEWFVHLRFPGHEHTKIIDGIPEGWERKQGKDILGTVKRPRKIMKTEFLDDGPIPCVDQSRDFIGGYTDDEESIIDIGKPVIVFGDHTRILKFVDFPFASGADGTQLIASIDESISQEFLYFALDSIDLSNYFYARHFKFLKDKYIPKPTNALLAQFTSNVRPMLKQINPLREHCYYLAKARDLLLPCLMSGRVIV